MRISAWEESLSDYIANKRHEPFEYGVNDCCLFAAGAVEVITGEDPMSEFRGQYDSLKTSLKAIKDIGAGTLEATMDGKFPEVAIGHAQRGDLAFFGDSVGVVMGGFAYFVSDDGLERINRSLWDKCWSVGRG
ncbi:MAG: hypothetical protein JGK24_28120 [Microcoleus sp. PH2017_29_MFU_D_A]|uniref:DUF6950 family protein n=1 Tax=Microcoleus sp. PH2017_29_MFU_D_A TaxID=2798839 RepID=UPI001E12701C|nr:hypothetical protein [Microcoleus sp. PH2017_29_MFU_D_A]MCC3606985.1 hypothetical protein [Microcoleus sp. PH2017_29_MFU_D_A]